MTESKTLCVNHQRFFHQMRTQEVNTPFDLLAWLKLQPEFPKFFWHGRDGLEVAAYGVELMLNEIPQFDRDNDSTARFWGGHSFFSSSKIEDNVWKNFPRCAFFIPKFELVKQGKKITIIQHSINRPFSENPSIIPNHFDDKNIEFNDGVHFPIQSHWNKMINSALHSIEGQVIEKVVMARRSTHTSEKVLDPYKMLSEVEAENATRFAIQFTEGSAFIGASPERLYLRKGLTLYTEALAGTCKINDPESTLFCSEKDLHEFELVKNSIRKNLELLCQKLQSAQKDRILKTSKVKHLHSTFHGTLKQNVSDSELLSSLHPSAATGGLPKAKALEHIENFEPFERGWYASPIGYISQEKAELCVGIRSALVSEKQIHLFAGTGIVKGSEPDREWEELQQKMSLWRD